MPEDEVKHMQLREDFSAEKQDLCASYTLEQAVSWRGAERRRQEHRLEQTGDDSE